MVSEGAVGYPSLKTVDSDARSEFSGKVCDDGLMAGDRVAIVEWMTVCAFPFFFI